MRVDQRLKLALKLSVSSLLYSLGLLQLWQRRMLRGKAVVLMYHRVLTQDERGKTGSHPGIVVSCEAFSAQMALLKEHFKVLSAEEFADRMERRVPFENASCLITFDDGWRDNYTHALPILQQYGLPALVFLPVNLVGGRRLFWQEHLTHLVVRAVMLVRRQPERHGRLCELLAPMRLDAILDCPDSHPQMAVAEAVRREKTWALSLINATLVSLTDELGLQLAEYEHVDGFLDWGQVGCMAQQGIAFGGHGAEHRILTSISPDEALEEIRTAKQVLERYLPHSISAFSYPNGNWSPDVAKLLEKSEYRLAFTTEPGHVSCEDDRFTLRRVNIHEGLMDSKPMFLARIVGLF